MRTVYPSMRSQSCLSSGRGICSGEKFILSRISCRNWRRRRRVCPGSASKEATEGTLEGEPEEKKGGNTMRMSGRLFMVSTGDWGCET